MATCGYKLNLHFALKTSKSDAISVTDIYTSTYTHIRCICVCVETKTEEEEPAGCGWRERVQAGG